MQRGTQVQTDLSPALRAQKIHSKSHVILNGVANVELATRGQARLLLDLKGPCHASLCAKLGLTAVLVWTLKILGVHFVCPAHSRLTWILRKRKNALDAQLARRQCR